jgi:hypothetical protein
MLNWLFDPEPFTILSITSIVLCLPPSDQANRKIIWSSYSWKHYSIERVQTISMIVRPASHVLQ